MGAGGAGAASARWVVGGGACARRGGGPGEEAVAGPAGGEEPGPRLGGDGARPPRSVHGWRAAVPAPKVRRRRAQIDDAARGGLASGAEIVVRPELGGVLLEVAEYIYQCVSHLAGRLQVAAVVAVAPERAAAAGAGVEALDDADDEPAGAA